MKLNIKRYITKEKVSLWLVSSGIIIGASSLLSAKVAIISGIVLVISGMVLGK